MSGETQSGPSASEWPRGAVPISVLILLGGVVMALLGIGSAGDESAAVRALTVAAAVLAVPVFALGVRSYASEPARRPLVLAVVLVVSVALFVLTRTSVAPIGVAGLGGALVGCMIGNIMAVRRARRVA